MDPRLKEHLEDIFELLGEVIGCLQELHTQGTQGAAIQDKLNNLKTHYQQAARLD
jgi:hypothetical protein